MKFLIELTYYRPHTSGLTIYAERLARALVQRGHKVTILTSQYDRRLSSNEYIDGVKIVRVPVLMRISKGVVMPSFGLVAHKLVMEHDALSLHLPQLDAAGLAFRGRIYKKPTIITYHCDLRMPPGAIPWVANQSVNLMNNLAAIFTHRIVAYTQDYADHSLYLRKYSQTGGKTFRCLFFLSCVVNQRVRLSVPGVGKFRGGVRAGALHFLDKTEHGCLFWWIV